MKTNLEWRTPRLICLKSSELICKIKARANSGCSFDYTSDNMCDTDSSTYFCHNNVEDYDTGGDIQCGILSNCIVGSGVALGCTHSYYCSEIVFGLK